MRIALDATCLPSHYGGAAAYIIQLIRSVARIDRTNEYWIFAKPRDVGSLTTGSPNMKLVSIELGNRAARLLWEQAFLPGALKRLRIDLLHSMHYTSPLSEIPCRRIVTFHDLTVFLLPEHHPRARRTFFRQMMRRSSVLADRILVNSETTRADLMSVLGVAPGKISVTRLGVTDGLVPETDSARLSLLRARYGLRSPLILYLGEWSSRKNLERLVDAFETISLPEPATLAFAGLRGYGSSRMEDRVRRSPCRDRIRLLGYVPDEDLSGLYSAADVFVYPSHYEGFGLPVAEAMACGTPVITSDRPALVEVAGNAGLSFDPTETRGLSCLLSRVLADAALRNELRNKGLKRAGEFRWEDTAQGTVEAYRKAMFGAA